MSRPSRDSASARAKTSKAVSVPSQFIFSDSFSITTCSYPRG